LPDGDGTQAVQCRFCGLVHEAAGVGSDVTVHHVRLSGASLKPELKWIMPVIAVITVGVVVPALVWLYIGWVAVSNIATSPSMQSHATSTRLAPANLRTAPAGYHDLDAAPPAGGFAAVDAVTAVPWALTIAQSWSADARLERIDVTRMRPDGTVNVQDDREALIRYRFRSPARMTALLEQSRLSASARGIVGLFLVVEHGALRAYVEESAGAPTERGGPPPHPAVMPLSRLVTVPAVEQVTSDAPFLSGYLIHLDDEGWVWYFSTLAGESKPRVRGRDGAVWPYRRAR
jgi:hypothetical protein